ncbi:MAG TPA: hypothetical protein V6D25_05095 [Leptolyngbyaceae cyanobacterium]
MLAAAKEGASTETASLFYVPCGTLRERGACRRQRLRQRDATANGFNFSLTLCG